MDNKTEQSNKVPTAAESTNFENIGSNMKVLAMALVVVIVAVVAALLIHNSSNSSSAGGTTVQTKTLAPAVVSITANGFVPATIHVSVNQAVAWTNKDSHPHAVASDPYPTDNILPSLNSGQTNIAAHNSYSYIFKTAGTYTYHDTLHPSVTGTVIVGSTTASSNAK